VRIDRRRLEPWSWWLPWRVTFAAMVPLVAPAQERALDSVGTCWTYRTSDADIRVDVIARGLDVPVGFAFLPDGRALVAERQLGRLSYLDLKTGRMTPIDGVPLVDGKVDGGLMEIVLDTGFASNKRVFVSYAEHTDSGNATVVEQARLDGTRLVGRRRLLTAVPYVANDGEFGSRMVVDRGYLYISLGQRDTPPFAQDLSSTNGKIVRLRLDGSIPEDNPFVGRQGARGEIWSYGHRNAQGLAINPRTGELWEHEHGPRGGDEINIIRRGRNYGWPVITYGIEYSGQPVGQGLTSAQGMEQPLYYYVPSIAPSGMSFFAGRTIPRWEGNLFLGSMSYRHLNRLVLSGDRVVREERLLRDRHWRIREVRQAPDGTLYLGIESGLVVSVRAAGPAAAGCQRGLGADDPWVRAPHDSAALGRADASAAVDADSRLVVRYESDSSFGVADDPTWEWNGEEWTATRRSQPVARRGQSVATDPSGGVLLFGGVGADGQPLGDSWRYHGHMWAKLDGSGPEARSGAAMAYDGDHARVFLFGGSSRTTLLADSWIWDGAGWKRVATSGPSPRSDAAFAYDPMTRTALLFGGRDASGRALSDSWRWDGSSWRRLDASGPAARQGATLVYSPSRSCMLLLGGVGADGVRSDMWCLSGDRWRSAGTTPRLQHPSFVTDPYRDRIVLVGTPLDGGNVETYLLLRE